jgi:hypothetical protein
MPADEKLQRGAGSARTDRVGKVFVVVNKGVRKCLVCEEFFTRRTAPEHAKALCVLVVGMKTGGK